MIQRIRNIRQKPAPVPAAPPPKAHPLDAALSRLGLPGLLIRQFIADLQSLRSWWPILLPAMLYVAITTYRQERAKLAAKK